MPRGYVLSETDIDAARENADRMQELLAVDLPYVVLYSNPIIEAYRSDRLKLPFTETLDGLQNLDGYPTGVLAVLIE